MEPNAIGSITGEATVDAAEDDPGTSNNIATEISTINNAHACTIIGTPGNDALNRTVHNVICSLGGNDTIDTIDASASASTVYAGPGNDVVNGGNGPPGPVGRLLQRPRSQTLQGVRRILRGRRMRGVGQAQRAAGPWPVAPLNPRSPVKVVPLYQAPLRKVARSNLAVWVRQSGVLSLAGFRIAGGIVTDGSGEITEAIEQLRGQLLAAQKSGENESLRFQIAEVEMEFAVEVRKDGGGSFGVQLGVVKVGADGALSRGQTHRLRLKLNVTDRTTGRPGEILDRR
ncbi:hypothetical protein J5X84_15645 [Streptosporangiaceae bacterium NEAU-GS5]|nr:hypothetical protein [Streptosporangiaceae bacterium NEAU-GS5]